MDSVQRILQVVVHCVLNELLCVSLIHVCHAISLLISHSEHVLMHANLAILAGFFTPDIGRGCAS